MYRIFFNKNVFMYFINERIWGVPYPVFSIRYYSERIYTKATIE